MERKSPNDYIPDGSHPGTTHTDGGPEKEVDTYRRQDNYSKIRSKPEDQY